MSLEAKLTTDIGTAMKAKDATRLAERHTAQGTTPGHRPPLLEADCLGHQGSARLVALDVTGIGFVDRQGAVMVRSLVDKGVRLVGASALVEALLRRTAT